MPLQGFKTSSGRGLGSLPRALLDHLASLLEPVIFASGQTVQRAGAAVRNCYFVETGLVALSLPDANDHAVEVGMTGPGGLVGVPAVLTGRRSLHAVHARSLVRALRVEAEALRASLSTSAELRDLVAGYADAMLEQTQDLVACTARHSLEQRLARWIFVASHHAEGEPLHVTHEALSEMLCVRRAGVTTALHRLEGEHAIHASRGTIRVRDPAILERFSCGCHRIVLLGTMGDIAGTQARQIPDVSAGSKPSLPSAMASRCPNGSVGPASLTSTLPPELKPAGMFELRLVHAACEGVHLRTN